jgi:hypothetical protein
MTEHQLIVFGTIALAVICWAVGEGFGSRLSWTTGAALAIVHSVAAFVTFYDGSHDVARIETSRQTAALTGVAFSGGIYINYAFLVVWAGDALWWWCSPASRAARRRALSIAIRGFIFFMIVNGAVVFADGWARVVGIVAIAMAAAGTWRRRLNGIENTQRTRPLVLP